jgi:phosphatidylserine decarboxylase
LSKDPYVPGWKFRKVQEGSILASVISALTAGTLAVLFSHWLLWVIWGSCLAVMFLVLYFFRDPDRTMQRSPAVFYSPGDGVVNDIMTIHEEAYPELEFNRIGIFLSVFDVHVQRAPVEGEIEFITHRIGKNLPAYDPEASAENDQIVMGIKSKFGLILIKQIAGILARKCINYARVGDQIESGQRYGLIKFGSRVELYLPMGATILCQVGDKVKAGLTEMAIIQES